MSLLAEQQDIHESVMKKALSLLSEESEEDTADEIRKAGGEKAVRSNGSIPPKGTKLRKQSIQWTKRRREATPDGTAPVC